MATYEHAITTVVEELVAVLHQQQKLLRQNKWPHFMTLSRDSERLLAQLLDRRHDVPQVPHALRQRLLRAYEQMQWILMAQKHQVGEELKHLRKKRPAIRLYRKWSRTKQSYRHAASL